MNFTELSVTVAGAALTVAAFASLLYIEPVRAQDKTFCVETMDHVRSVLDGHGISYNLIKPEDLAAFAEQVKPMTGAEPEDVTGALVADFGSALAFGVETSDGCFSPQPMVLATAVPAV